MKRFLMLVGVAVVAAAMYVAAAPGSQQAKGPSAKQFSTLKKQVATLSKTVKTVKTVATAEAKLLTDCVKVAVPVDQFGDGQNQTEGYDYIQGPIATPTTEFLTTALDVSDSTDANAVWFVGGQGKACATDLGESTLQHAAAKAGIRLPHATMHSFSFIPRQR
jgi:hypothetical protein